MRGDDYVPIAGFGNEILFVCCAEVTDDDPGQD